MELFRVLVNVTQTHQVCSEGNCVNMLLFDGMCEGEYFQGRILSGGVDTQCVAADGKGTLSARYMLEGVDKEGIPCKIYIQNDAEINTGNGATHPKIFTDSKCLKWLEKETLVGRILWEKEQLIISIRKE